MPGALDFAILAGALGLTLVEHFVGWPRLRAAIASGAPQARVLGYKVVLAEEWLVTIAILLRWATTSRSWAALWLVRPTPWGLVVASVLTVVTAWLLLVQWRSVARLNPESRRAAGRRLGTIGDSLPHTPGEHRWFMALSITAGFCEELVYRGFIVWAFTPTLGLYGAAAASVIIFGIGHAYQGRAGTIRATLTGAVLAALALAAHSVIPGMLLHAIIDLGGGHTAYALLRETASTPSSV
jgi:uncharacterized protein